jgi:hypothetical protein
MVGLGFLNLSYDGTRSSTEDWVSDIAVLTVVCVSVAYWMLAIGFSTARPCQRCPRFISRAFQIQMTNHPNNEDNSSSAPPQVELENEAIEEKTCPKPCNKIPHNLSMMPQIGSKDENEIEFEPHESLNMDESSLAEWRKEPNRSMSRGDSTIISSIHDFAEEEDDDEMGTVIEEVWVDENGELIDDHSNGEWTDSETGMRIA